MDTREFKTQAAFREWLGQNHDKVDGIWLRIYKKGSGRDTVTYSEALDEALCFGWIDGQKKSLDEVSWIQKFTPRRKRSQWSKNNRDHVQRLMQSGQMTVAGLKEVEAAQADGRWEAAYDAFGSATLPDEFLVALEKNPKAKAFFATLNKTNRYAISYRLQTAKRPETRERRIRAIVEMLERGESFH